MNLPRRLGRNQNGYRGERIEIEAVLRDDLHWAERWGWEVAELPVSAGLALLGFRRLVARPRHRLYLSTGIHGDEPAGPLAVRELLQANRWPGDVELWLCPCLNPTGFRLNRRENAAGFDLNRDYRHLETPEVRAHVEWLQRQPDFDSAICLHEDWETPGFYLYELNPDHRPSLAERIVTEVSRVCPVDHAPEIEGRPAQGGIIRPALDPAQRPQWPEAFYLVSHKTRHSYTLEAPSDFALSIRVAALVTAVSTVIASLEAT
jgi:hypothetical protein